MEYKEIRQFDDVLMYELQRNKIKTLTFSQMWSVCAAAAPQIPIFTGSDEVDHRSFASSLLGNIANLEHRGYVTVYRRREKIQQISLTQRGNDWLQHVTFTHQDRMGE